MSSRGIFTAAGAAPVDDDDAGGRDAGNDTTGAGLGSDLESGTTGSIFGIITDPGRGVGVAAGAPVTAGAGGAGAGVPGVSAATAPDLLCRSNEKSETGECDARKDFAATHRQWQS